jgi:hypothetical protein
MINGFRTPEEVRKYLSEIKSMVSDGKAQISKIVTAVKLPTGAIEIAVNDQYLEQKLEYILSAYDDQMHLNSNKKIVMIEAIVV